MARSLRPWSPSSFSDIPAQHSRAFSAYVAIAAGEVSPIERNDIARWLAIGSFGMILAGLTSGGNFGRALLAIGLVCAPLAVLALYLRERMTMTFAGDVEKRRAHVARVVVRLDRDRRSKGLDHTIEASALGILESAAEFWERIEHSLQSAVWAGDPNLRRKVALAARRAMDEATVLMLGNPLVMGVPRDEIERRIRTAIKDLETLGEDVESAIAAVDNYARPNEESSGVVFPEVLREVAHLKERLIQMDIDHV